MTKEELLIPRYKVIATYPDSKFKIGDIIYVHHNTPYQSNNVCTLDKIYNPNVTQWIDLSEAEKHPNIFKKLMWWEERKLSDMPIYVLSVYENGGLKHGSIAKISSNGIFEDDVKTECRFFAKIDGQNNRINYSNLFPSTKEEFNKYQNETTL